MRPRRLKRDVQRTRDLTVSLAVPEAREDLLLARCQRERCTIALSDETYQSKEIGDQNTCRYTRRTRSDELHASRAKWFVRDNDHAGFRRDHR